MSCVPFVAFVGWRPLCWLVPHVDSSQAWCHRAIAYRATRSPIVLVISCVRLIPFRGGSGDEESQKTIELVGRRHFGSVSDRGSDRTLGCSSTVGQVKDCWRLAAGRWVWWRFWRRSWRTRRRWRLRRRRTGLSRFWRQLDRGEHRICLCVAEQHLASFFRQRPPSDQERSLASRNRRTRKTMISAYAGRGDARTRLSAGHGRVSRISDLGSVRRRCRRGRTRRSPRRLGV